MSALQIYQPNQITTPRSDAYSRRILGEDNPYTIFFDFDRARRTVMNGDYRVNTIRAYEMDLDIFIEFLTSRRALPTPDVMQEYKFYLGQPHYRRNKKGEPVFETKPRASSTKNRMLVPARLFCRALADQQHDYVAVHTLALQYLDQSEADNIQLTLWQLKDSLRRAADCDAFKEKLDANASPLMQYGTRLELPVARDFIRSLPAQTLHDMRDKTILILMFNTALREHEARQLTLAHFTPTDGAYTITMERKGGKKAITPCPVSVFQIVTTYIEAHNQYLDSINAAATDPRRISHHTPIFRRFHRFNPYPSGEVLSDAGLRYIIQTRALHYNPTLKLNPHDLRRTAAYIALKNGMPMHKIQQLLGHNDISTTMRYVGKLEQWDESCLDTYGALIS